MTSRRLRPSTKIEVRPSAGKGRGVFVTKAVRRGEVIEVAPALLVPTADASVLSASFMGHYVFQTDDGKRLVVALGNVSLINHADEPNATFDVFVDRIIIKAQRPIAPGVEVTIDYGWTNSEWKSVLRT